ncbi:hypothetical protein ABZ865_06695 [Streptomyces sp. NPDC047085]|jgi:hypothetical protein|uniref:hypothetical protein n=1 Tax=Streptomyces sp. NPDC047085 TaxID=3155140 RepID=UPI0033F64F13
MRKNSPVKGHHGLAARGQGKLLYYHTQASQAAIEQAKNQQQPPVKRPPQQEHRQADGRWTS